MRRTSWLAILIVIVLGSGVGIAAGSFLAWWLPLAGKFHQSPFGFLQRNPFGDKPIAHILLIGEDDTGGKRPGRNGLSDTLVVLAINTETKEIRAISIPRDTRVEVPGHGTRKINAAHAMGGPELTRQVIHDLLGVPIDYYIKTSTSGLKGLVELVHGVYVPIDKPMHYTDRHAGLYIHLDPKFDSNGNPEKQLLGPNEAEGFVRFRHDRIGDSGWDIVNGKKVAAGRIVRQQMFMRALANRILSLPTRRERAEVLAEAYDKKYIVSDLNLSDWDALSDLMKDLQPDKMQMAVLPGAPGNMGGVSYWIPDYDKVAQLVAVNMRFEKQAQAEDVSASVEVLNGSGISNVATKVADRLKGAGFEVTRTGNAPNFDYSRCQVISHKGKGQSAERIARLLNCEDVQEDGSASGADVTVIVGRDFRE